ncbi:non-homologous end-joining DNA ligase [Tepidiforma sp.]|uniref:non-homologous end-joining DNA ligase n=1 Tax=Tepidiforma sp. TaxID=2682230 RepID=UPI002ADDD81C|nr:non-homologous end-joining DNA ligase [Tepidiforma sp.]
MPPDSVTIEAAGQTVTITNPQKLYFPAAGITKLEVVTYYLTVAEAALRGVRGRPQNLKRFVDGIEKPPFFQKRAPSGLPPYVRTARVAFPSGRSANLVVIDDAAGLAWLANLGCIDLNPWPVRAEDTDHPDELRFDLDPTPEADFGMVKEAALLLRDLLREYGYTAYPKTSGSRGIHIYVRIQPRWDFIALRRAALALGREAERRAPGLVTTAWWKEERRGVFIDYNQNARDRTMASAYSLRPTPDARVSTPVTWDELPGVELAQFTIRTVPARLAAIGDPAAGLDDVAHSLEPLLELVRRHEAEGLGDAPYPPHFPKAPGEPPRVQPSRARRPRPGGG